MLHNSKVQSLCRGPGDLQRGKKMRRKTETGHVHAAAKKGFIKPRRSLPSVKQSSRLHGGMECTLGAAGAVLLAD